MTNTVPYPKFIDDFVIPAIGECLAELRRDCEVRINVLEASVARLEDAIKEFRYLGAWQEGKRYRRGNFVTLGGSIWHANSDSDSRPGSDDTWTLACKSGRDGRDGKDWAPQPAEHRSATMTTRQR
jgi:hypothetical protein